MTLARKSSPIEVLFMTMFFVVSLHGLFRVPSSMNRVSPSSVCVVCCLFVLSALVMFGGFAMMPRGVSVVF